MKRKLWLGLLLVATLIATWFAPGQKAATVATVSLPAHANNLHATHFSQERDVISSKERNVIKKKSAAALSPPVEVLVLAPRLASEEENTKLFTLPPWAIPKPPPIVQSAPVVAQAPPLPFQFLGRYIEQNSVEKDSENSEKPDDAHQANFASQKSLIFLRYGEQNLTIKIGDVILGQYKAESLNGSTLSLRYLPLNQIQMLELGSAQ